MKILILHDETGIGSEDEAFLRKLGHGALLRARNHPLYLNVERGNGDVPALYFVSKEDRNLFSIMLPGVMFWYLPVCRQAKWNSLMGSIFE